MRRQRRGERRERDVGIICVIIYDDLALEAKRESERERERGGRKRGKAVEGESYVLLGVRGWV